ENLTVDEQHALDGLLTGPVGSQLRVARAFLEEIWEDDQRNRRTPKEAERRDQIWQTEPAAANVMPLRRQQQHLDMDHFRRLSALRPNPSWEPTNNAAQRSGRAFRHGQHPHFRLRLVASIETDLKIRAFLKKERFCSPPPARLHRCQRGRRKTRAPG